MQEYPRPFCRRSDKRSGGLLLALNTEFTGGPARGAPVIRITNSGRPLLHQKERLCTDERSGLQHIKVDAGGQIVRVESHRVGAYSLLLID